MTPCSPHRDVILQIQNYDKEHLVFVAVTHPLCRKMRLGFKDTVQRNEIHVHHMSATNTQHATVSVLFHYRVSCVCHLNPSFPFRLINYKVLSMLL